MNQKLEGAEGGRLDNVENRDADRRPTTADEAGTLAGEIVGSGREARGRGERMSSIFNLNPP